MAAIMIDVRKFLARYTGEPMVWGVDDCSLLIADWWRDNHGTDPASDLRGTYTTETDKRAVVEAAGGLVELVTSLADRVGAVRVHPSRDGDFAVIVAAGPVMACGIRVGGYWAVRSETGVAFVRDARVVRGWTL